MKDNILPTILHTYQSLREEVNSLRKEISSLMREMDSQKNSSNDFSEPNKKNVNVKTDCSALSTPRELENSAVKEINKMEKINKVGEIKKMDQGRGSPNNRVFVLNREFEICQNEVNVYL